jgi:hypothetical protein
MLPDAAHHKAAPGVVHQPDAAAALWRLYDISTPAEKGTQQF